MQLCILLLLLSTSLYAATDTTSQREFRFELQLLPGVSAAQVQRTTLVDSSEYRRGGIALVARAMWHPDNLLGIGIETGLLRISSLRVYKDNVVPDGSVLQLNAIPVLGIAQLHVLGLEVHGGIGAYNYAVFFGGNGIQANSSEWELGYAAGISKAWYISKSFALGAEARGYVIPERDVSLLTVSARIQYSFWY